MKRLVYIFLLLLTRISAGPFKHDFKATDCLEKRCHATDPNKINVHLIPHSHDDVGWLKTVEDYYFGLHDDIQNVGVQYIIDSVLQALKQDTKRRYIQVETAFFWKWWNYQTEDKRKLFKSFVDNGQIEMVGGGWSMNDEACVNYQSTINQFTWGLRLLEDTLGECGRPTTGWQIDPFGHSREQASIFKQMGYDAFFFVRLSQDTKDERKLDKSLEFLWKSSDSLENSEIFTSILDAYYAPSGFCWDYLQCGADAINDDPDSFDYNLDKKVENFTKLIADYSEYFRTNNILFAMGGDFQYQAAERNYLNHDKLIKGFENNEKYNVIYSTPSCYYKAVSEASPNLTTFSGDFFPYAENDHAYWSGFYSSRSTLKRFERTGNNILQASQHLNSFAKMRNNTDDYETNVKTLREVMGTMQHHDAITGTEKERVASDYARMLTKAIKETERPIGRIIGNLLKKDGVTEDVVLPVSSCLLTNISICENSMHDKFMVAVYNPLSRTVSHYIRLPVQESTYKITGPDGNEEYDLLDRMEYHINTSSSSDVELLFAARNIPPMGIKYYYVEKLDALPETDEEIVSEEDRTFGTDTTSFTLNEDYILETVKMNDKTVKISQKFMVYISNNGSGDGISSGAYLFRPINGSDAYHIDYFKNGQQNSTQQRLVKMSFVRGNLVDEVVQVFNDWLTQTIRVYKGDDNNFIEFDWVVGPLDNSTIDTAYKHGKEIVSRFYVSDFHQDAFYTDSNGREMIKRTRNNYPYKNASIEPVTSNYYPVTSKISLQSETEDLQVSVLNDRSQGGSSLWDGEIELMVHRRMLKDDGKGLEEALQEKEFGNYIVARGQHYLVLGPAKNSSIDTAKSTTVLERELALKKLLQPWVLVGDATSSDWSLETVQAKINFQWSGLKSSLPDNVNILTLEPWRDDSYVLRLEHIIAKDEDSTYSKEVTVDISEIFSPYKIASIRETALAANELSSNFSDDYYYKSERDGFSEPYLTPPMKLNTENGEVVLGPMQIRTFIVTVTK